MGYLTGNFLNKVNNNHLLTDDLLDAVRD